MISKLGKEKNIRDLEYSRLLSQQNLVLVLLGTCVISILLIDELPSDFTGTTRGGLIFILVVAAIGFLVFWDKKLEDKANEIRNL